MALDPKGLDERAVVYMTGMFQEWLDTANQTILILDAAHLATRAVVGMTAYLAATAPAEEEGWRTIESAPVDGDPQVVGYRHKGKWVYRLARAQLLEDGETPARHLMTRWLTIPGDWQITPTHWAVCILPDPPTPAPGITRRER